MNVEGSIIGVVCLSQLHDYQLLKWNSLHRDISFNIFSYLSSLETQTEGTKHFEAAKYVSIM